MKEQPIHYDYDAIVVGAGPNGLAAAITIARTGRSVLVLEGHDRPGGGMRSAQLTLPGFVHDVCSAVHPLGVSSPFFVELAPSLNIHGLAWIYPPAALAHPFDDGSAAVLERSIEATGETLGSDARAYARLMRPLAADWDSLVPQLLGPASLPRHPVALARFGLRALWPARRLAERMFTGQRARALFAGIAAHAILPLEQIATAAFGLVLGVTGHTIGWPVARGGSQAIADALVAYLKALGGRVVTGRYISSIDELPHARVVLFDVTPRQLVRIAGHRMPAGYRRNLLDYRYGPGVFKVDWALDGPIPWQATECSRAATVHLGGTLEEIAAAERMVWQGQHPEQPFVILAQQSLFDATRAPAGKHTAWAYCHVPHGSPIDMTTHIEAQIERFAPGFRERILARSSMAPADMQRYNPNYIGGDINGGVQDLRQLYTRPMLRLVPYSTPDKQIYICSASTPPGGGVHGMCGYHAARAALRRSL